MNTTEHNIATIASVWDRIVGPELAKSSRPIGLCDGALIVVTPSSEVMQTLAFLGSRIAREIPKMVPGVIVERLRLRQTRVRSAQA